MVKQLGRTDIKIVAAIVSIIVASITITVSVHEMSHKDEVAKIDRNYQMVVAAHREIEELKRQDTAHSVKIAKLQVKAGANV